MSRAFLFTGAAGAGGVMTDLDTLIDPASGWTLDEATGISDIGFITGYGTNPMGETHAFLLTPTPEPSGWVVLGLGALGLCGLARRRVRAKSSHFQSV